MFGRAGPGCGEDHLERVQPLLEGLHPREPIVLAQRSCRQVRSCLSLMWAVLDRAGRGSWGGPAPGQRPPAATARPPAHRPRPRRTPRGCRRLDHSCRVGSHSRQPTPRRLSTGDETPPTNSRAWSGSLGPPRPRSFDPRARACRSSAGRSPSMTSRPGAVSRRIPFTRQLRWRHLGQQIRANISFNSTPANADGSRGDVAFAGLDRNMPKSLRSCGLGLQASPRCFNHS